MKQLIACCGIDCETCIARIATISNDDVLREVTAQKCHEMFNDHDVTANSINCLGCRIDGVKLHSWNICEIRNCVKTKGFNTCGDCKELDTCPIVSFVFQNDPSAKENLLQ